MSLHNKRVVLVSQKKSLEKEHFLSADATGGLFLTSLLVKENALNTNALWHIERIDTDVYRLACVSEHARRYMDAASHDQVDLDKSGDDASVQWQIQKQDNGLYTLVSMTEKTYLNVSGYGSVELSEHSMHWHLLVEV